MADLDDLTTAALHLDSMNITEWGIHFSSYTGKWFVHALGLNLTDGSFLRGIPVHRVSPSRALFDFVAELRDEGQGESVISVRRGDQRRYYRWNGVAFAEVPDHMLPWKSDV